MRRLKSVASLCLFVGLGWSLVLAAHASAAEAPLPLKKIVLFTSGVGFFEHAAEIDGDNSIELKFNTGDINDLLKSMVLEDRGGGRISTVTYASKDPVTKILGTFAIDLTRNPSLADLLDQVRGEKVELEAPNRIEGTLVGVERRKEQVGKGDELVEKQYMNLLTSEGLRSLPLASVARIKLVDEKLDSELRQALAVLAMAHSNDKKSVTLDFQGKGRRAVRVGYIQGTPVWKTSYRLVLDDKQKPRLQGWAIVENTTEHDWGGVRLTLVSGRPISFTMNLYDPLYVTRPEVEPELFASLRPQRYEGNLAERQAGRKATAMDRMLRSAPAPAAAAPALAAADSARLGLVDAAKAAGEQEQLHAKYSFFADGVQSAAQAGSLGELFQYEIDVPVTLPRRQSALLPIVQDTVGSEKVSIYNQSVQAKHPLNGLRLTNTTSLHLMQGPITVFDGGSYAGDARIEDLPPGGERLISYALDLDTEVAQHWTDQQSALVSVRLAKGTVYTDYKHVRSQKFTVKNSDQRAKQVLIEVPIDSQWRLAAGIKPTEKSRDVYRFAVEAKPDKPAELQIAEEMTAYQQVAATSLTDDNIQFYLRARSISAQVKDALAEIVRQKTSLEKLTREQAELRAQITVIEQEQERIRRNMSELDRNSDLYLRYVKKFSTQEDEVEKYREKINELQTRIDAERKTLDDYIAGLEVS